MRPLRAVHQFHVGSAYGDGVTNGMLLTRRLLRSLGLRSEIFAVVIPPELQGNILPHTAYRHAHDQLLLVHHSMGHEIGGWIESVIAPKVLVYHNITPEHFFPEGDPHRAQAALGRRQLSDWARAGVFEGAVAVSPFNAEELRAHGYGPLETIPLLVDLDELRRAAQIHQPGHATAAEILFVGRLTPHKCQLQLLDAISILSRKITRPVRLTLAGKADPAYLGVLRERVRTLGLERVVRFPGPLTNAELRSEYRKADLFICLSDHEGFGMPLVEAAVFGVPVLAYAVGNVADTVGEGALLLHTKAPEAVAEAAQRLLDEPPLRHSVLAGQVRSLDRYEPSKLLARLVAFLQRLGFILPEVMPANPRPTPTLRIEGPFDSSYSLAIVNRELALGLERLGVPAALRTTEEGGTKPPDGAFLARNPEVAKLSRRSNAASADVVLLNTYPPDVDAMGKAPIRGLACYAWEETGFPIEYAEAFNRTLDVITVTSQHVRKTLEDNGVRTPIHVVGNGVDHTLRTAARSRPLPVGDRFVFLHVSSAFPRKGVDALIEAWGRAFRQADHVALVIKTFPNPHNTVASQLEELAHRYPEHAPVVLIDEDVDAGTVRGLYEACDAFVAPARCEGFGLPLAEAMLLRKPVITTSFSGQTDFCLPDTAWLVDWRYAQSGSHLDLPCSAWADPDVDDLARQLRNLFQAPREERDARVTAAYNLIVSRYSWDAVAARVRAAVDMSRQTPASVVLPRVAWVSTWNTRCGIATYSEALTVAVPADQLRILANADADLLGPDGANVERPWRATREDNLEELHAAIERFQADAVVLQFNFGFYDLPTLGRLIERLADEGRSVYLMLHSTMDVDKPELRASLRDIAPALAKARRLLVHSVPDLNRLKAIGLIENATLFPHGYPSQPNADEVGLMRERLGLMGKRVIGSFGFLLPHKGLRELLGAFARLREQDPSLHLLMLNALYPAWESEAELKACQDFIAASGLESSVTMRTDFLEEREALAMLSLSEVVVFPYQHTQESASGAVRLGLATGRAVAVSPLPIFDDVSTITSRLPGTTVEALSEGLSKLLADPAARVALEERQARWVGQLTWPRLSQRLWNLIRATSSVSHETVTGTTECYTSLRDSESGLR